MHKFFLCLLWILSLFTRPLDNTADVQKLYLNQNNLGLHSSSVILIEPTTKRILYSDNENEKHYPASMTKMMGMYLVLDAVENGKASFKDIVTCSDYASSMGGTQIYLEPGEQMTIEDLFKSVCVNSANDAITALGEHLFGSNDGFVEAMNKAAKDLGMNNTNFVNCTGFDDDNHYTTCYDMALVACELVKFGQKLFRFTSLKEAYVRETTSNPFWLVSTNKMLSSYEGMDGLKTGFTNKANYNLTATAIRNNVRLISVVMNEDTIKNRTEDTTALLNYGFSRLKALNVLGQNVEIMKYTFKSAREKDTPVKTRDEVIIIVEKEIELKDLSLETRITKGEASLNAHDIVGELVIHDTLNNTYVFPLVIDHDIKKVDFWNYLLDYFLGLFV